MKRLFSGLLMALLFSGLFFLSFTNPAAASTGVVTLKLSSSQATVDGAVYDLPAAPVVKEGVTLVPLRFLVETLGMEVSWDSLTREVNISTQEGRVQLKPGSKTAVVKGEMQQLPCAPVISNGTTLVPLRFVAETFKYQVNYDAFNREIRLEPPLPPPPPPPPNRPPVARFEVEKTTVAQGETVIYRDESYDPDGDELVEVKWTGKQRAFFKPGEYTVTLQVRDSRGAWSEIASKTITVTREVVMDEITYNLHNPIPGEPLDLSGIEVLQLPVVDPATTMNREMLVVSNSPEIFTREGILYTDTIQGDTRLYYHHINGSTVSQRVYLLATNQGLETAAVTIKRQALAGPGDPMAAGRAATYRYLAADTGQVRTIYIKPGETRILMEDSRPIAPGLCVHGILDLNTDREVQLTILALEKGDPVTAYRNLPVLPPDGIHIRGTFPRANRFLSVHLYENKPARLIIADGDGDSFLYGRDGTTNLVGYNKGNYGVSYEITIESKYRMGVFFSPRGGPFAGAATWEGQPFYLPNRGVLNPPNQGALVGIIEPGQRKTLRFMPPAASYLPINLIFVPF
ncbi:Copper amine oxidase N-terminal domain-containing protein [Desulfofundulus australicus DSM 11792]|uniref:Copper amine oxidase N-terminal domain-containing protein n=1 Tax=Desulfofundulus australicus DSM 11792 TaxID=1121425 RepID=A0A1M4WXF9_9FIRM|nr:stalk domain-containing protein [Desulfofundulus australicus]SHE85981.1 Copper amine oxidase N-terminal domain-containing protein [Desulfofundulus australicus DSM 11792]